MWKLGKARYFGSKNAVRTYTKAMPMFGQPKKPLLFIYFIYSALVFWLWLQHMLETYPTHGYYMSSIWSSFISQASTSKHKFKLCGKGSHGSGSNTASTAWNETPELKFSNMWQCDLLIWLIVERHVVGQRMQRQAVSLFSTADCFVVCFVSGQPFYTEEGSTVWQVLCVQSGSRVLLIQMVSS